MGWLSFLFLDDFEGNAKISVAIKSGSRVNTLSNYTCTVHYTHVLYTIYMYNIYILETKLRLGHTSRIFIRQSQTTHIPFYF